MSDRAMILLAFGAYLSAMLGVGIWAARSRTGSMADFFLGGRKLGSLVVALSAVVSGRSSWLILGVSGAAYVNGISAVWALPGYIVTELLLFLTLGMRLRRYTQAADDITIPDFLESRYRDRGLLRIAAVCVIVFFFTLYISAQLSAGQRAFSMIFRFEDVLPGMVIITVFVALYTVLGGYAAVALTDVIQAFFMLLSLVALPIYALLESGGLGALERFLAGAGEPSGAMLAWGSAIAAVNGLSIGFGSIGNPHILVRYMSIADARKLERAALIGTFWNVIMGWGAVLIGLVARMRFPEVGMLFDGDKECAFLNLGQTYLHPLLFGFAASALIAAIMSTVDSQLLVVSSGVARDLYQKTLKRGREVPERRMVLLSRLTVLAVITVAFFLGIVVSRHKADWPIFRYVLLAWSGLGAAFGPALILSLYWRRTTRAGVLAGLVGGLAMTLAWKGLGQAYGWRLAEYLPGFAFAFACVVVVSLLTRPPEGVDEDWRRMGVTRRPSP